MNTHNGPVISHKPFYRHKILPILDFFDMLCAILLIRVLNAPDLICISFITHLAGVPAIVMYIVKIRKGLLHIMKAYTVCDRIKQYQGTSSRSMHYARRWRKQYVRLSTYNNSGFPNDNRRARAERNMYAML